MPIQRPRLAKQWLGDIDQMPLEWIQNGLIKPSRDGSLLVITRNGPQLAPKTDQIAVDLWRHLYPVPDELWRAGYHLEKP